MEDYVLEPKNNCKLTAPALDLINTKSMKNQKMIVKRSWSPFDHFVNIHPLIESE